MLSTTLGKGGMMSLLCGTNLQSSSSLFPAWNGHVLWCYMPHMPQHRYPVMPCQGLLPSAFARISQLPTTAIQIKAQKRLKQPKSRTFRGRMSSPAHCAAMRKRPVSARYSACLDAFLAFDLLLSLSLSLGLSLFLLGASVGKAIWHVWGPRC